MGLSRKSAASNVQVPTRASLRRLLVEVLRTDSELDAFCLDYYPTVKREFTAGLLRTGKLNVLLSYAPTDDILARLRESHPEETARRQHIINLGDGRDVLSTTLLDARERRNRQRLLERVRKFWIEGVLEKSLHGAVMMELGKEYQPEAVAYPWDMVLQRPDTEPQPIPKERRMIELHDENLGELLILGAPGSGKTTMLLDLCRDLVRRAEVDELHPIPVVFNLSSWAQKRLPIGEWFVEELLRRYDIPRTVGAAWVESAHILPLLDGLDEVSLQHRAACIEAVNRHRENHSTAGFVVCSRSEAYTALPALLRLENAVVLQPLTVEQIDSWLNGMGEQTQKLRAALQHDAQLLELANTPLMLSILLYVNQNDEIKQTSSLGQEQHRQQLLAGYCASVMKRSKNSNNNQSFLSKTKKIAQLMTSQSQTIFHFEVLQPEILNEKMLKHLCYLGGYSIITTFVAIQSACLIFATMNRDDVLICAIGLIMSYIISSNGNGVIFGINGFPYCGHVQRLHSGRV